MYLLPENEDVHLKTSMPNLSVVPASNLTIKTYLQDYSKTSPRNIAKKVNLSSIARLLMSQA